MLDQQDKQALRKATIPMVEAMVKVLLEHGMTKTEACKAVRWAAHVVEGRNESGEGTGGSGRDHSGGRAPG
jgi:hypothetical protein